MTMTAAAQADAATVLANAAFGDDPARWPLPAATTPHELWLRAVVAGGQGRYGSALADLAGVCRLAPPGPLVSLAHSTRASFLRQLGWHTRARGWDGRALAQAAEDSEAGVDALIGLAADALGVGRLPASARLLQWAREVMSDVPGRVPVRLAWVNAELAMASGDGAAAVSHAERAAELATSLRSARHTVKSTVILAAALCSSGAVERARRVADSALDDAGRLGIIPLRWALACLLTDIGSEAHPPARIVAIRDQAAEAVRRWGGVWSDR
jgi:hypothetical protein